LDKVPTDSKLGVIIVMEYNQFELDFEHNRLEETISLARKKLNEAGQKNEENKEAIISAKKELRENTSHSISGLLTSDGFEALAELSQYVNPVTEKIIDYEEVENKIALLENLIKSPYYARIDFRFDGEDTYEKIYIGRSSLMKDKYEMYVYDWRSPIASVFYRFVTGEVYYDAPSGRIAGEVNLKRQYEINNSKMEYFFDADVQIVDEFLRKLLSQNTSTKMKTIVETIQKEQDIVIRDMENDLMMVQGVAGSGKTSIALHRAAYLMYQGLSSKLSANNIIIISPNTLFEQYISNVLPELGEDNVLSVVFEDMVTAILQNKNIQSRNQFLENLITNSSYRKVIKSSIEFKTSHQFFEILNRFIHDIPEKWIEFEDVYYNGKCIVKKETLEEKITGRKDTPLGMKLKHLEDYIFEQIREFKKSRITQLEKANIKKEIQKFTELNVLELYKKLLNDKEYFDSLRKEYELPDSIEDIIVYTQENLDTNVLYYDDAIVLTYLSLKIFGTNEYKNIKQVVIDEAQDYYPLQYEIFSLLFTNSKFTILGDMNQTLEKQEDLSLYEQIGKILNKKRSTLVTMDKSFRCTNEVLNYSLKFIDQSPDIKSFNRNGDEPTVYVATNPFSLKEMIIAEVKTCQEKGYKSIGLICKTEQNALSLYENLKDSINLQIIKNESTADLDGVFIIPVYMSKGLEFDAVLVCDTDSVNYNTEDDKKLLYISCTRALHSLNLFCEGEASPLL
jgi:DNA helicase-2/ATP-dependent DNA helicase PcrA